MASRASPKQAWLVGTAPAGTAAHKTLPLGSTVRVTNLVNNESIMVKITDRGPFSHGRIIDLSEGAAKKIDLYRMGVAKVKVEAYTPASASATGKWVVQTGAFEKEGDAMDLKAALARRYAGSRVIEFKGATGYWVRIDPPTHDHNQAEAILEWIGKPDAQVVPYLVRVD
jgi:rare lipoprotein A